MSEQPARTDQSVLHTPSAAPALQCPACRAAWRNVTTCSRCGADLTALMQIALRAWELRQAARVALCAGNRTAEALALARTACQLHATPYGQRLLALALLAHGQMAEAYAVMAPLLS